MQDELAAVRRGAMLEDVHRLPGPERELAVDDRDRELRRGERGADVGGHVVGPLGGVAIEALVLGHELPEERVEVAEHVRVGVLLHDERGRGVPNEDGEKPGRHLLAVDPRSQLARYVVEAGAARPDGEAMSRLPHASGLAQRASLLELCRPPDGAPPRTTGPRRSRSSKTSRRTLMRGSIPSARIGGTSASAKSFKRPHRAHTAGFSW